MYSVRVVEQNQSNRKCIYGKYSCSRNSFWKCVFPALWFAPTRLFGLLEHLKVARKLAHSLNRFLVAFSIFIETVHYFQQVPVLHMLRNIRIRISRNFIPPYSLVKPRAIRTELTNETEQISNKEIRRLSISPTQKGRNREREREKDVADEMKGGLLSSSISGTFCNICKFLTPRHSSITIAIRFQNSSPPNIDVLTHNLSTLQSIVIHSTDNAYIAPQKLSHVL